MSIRIKEIECKTALSKSGLPGLLYALNPYRGCSHGCIYCYAPAILRESRKWGEFIDVKTNIPAVLSKEVIKVKKGVVGIGTVTDPYQDAEKTYQLTRKCLSALLLRQFPVSIQTKSSLILRDIDIIKQFEWCEVGFTVTAMDDRIRCKYEGGSPIRERLEALKKLKNSGIRTWAFIGPILPGITNKDDGLSCIIQELKSTNIDYILADRLRMKSGTWDCIATFLKGDYPELFSLYEDVFKRGGGRLYYDKVFSELRRLCLEHGITLKMAFSEEVP